MNRTTRTHFEQHIDLMEPEQPTQPTQPTKLSILLERSVKVEKAISDFLSNHSATHLTKQQAHNLLTDIVDITRRYPHRASPYDQIFQDSANHIPWTVLIDVLRNSHMRAESRDLPKSGRSWSISSGWFTTHLKQLLTESGLFELYKDPHRKGTERLRYIHFLPSQPAQEAFHGKRVRIMPSRPDLDTNDFMKGAKQSMVGRTGKAAYCHKDQPHGDDAYFVDLDPITKEEITQPICWIVIGDELEPLP